MNEDAYGSNGRGGSIEIGRKMAETRPFLTFFSPFFRALFGGGISK
jgi:hypothetical protein